MGELAEVVLPSQRLFPTVSTEQDGRGSVPHDPEQLYKFLTNRDPWNRIYNLDQLRNEDLNRLFSEYFEPYPRKPHPSLPQTPQGYARLFRGEGNREEYAKHTEVTEGTGRWWSAFLDDAAGYTEDRATGSVYYVEVPESVVQESHTGRLGEEGVDRPSTHPYEFFIPRDYLDGQKSTPKLLEWKLVDELLSDREYTQWGVDIGRIEDDSLTREEHTKVGIRQRLMDLAFNSLAGFRLSQKDPTEQKPRIIPDVKTAENLLARVCGWR